MNATKEDQPRQPRVFSTYNDSGANSTAVSTCLPRVFSSNEFLEKETGYWDDQLRDGQVNVDAINDGLAVRDKRTPHVLYNRAYTPIATESLKERRLGGRTYPAKHTVITDDGKHRLMVKEAVPIRNLDDKQLKETNIQPGILDPRTGSKERFQRFRPNSDQQGLEWQKDD